MASPPAFRVITPTQLRDLPPARMLGDTRLVAQGLSVVFGASGSYKSFYMLDKSLKLAQVMPVVFVAAEGSAGLNARVSAWCNYHGSEPGNISFVCQEVNLRDESSVSGLINSIKPLDPKLVVIDTLARCMVGGDENSAKDVGHAVYGCARIQRAFSASVGVVHHTNRADRGERGSGALRGAADSMIEIASTGDGVIRAACSKSKDTEPWATEELIFHPLDGSGVLLPADTLALLARKLSPQEENILEFLSLSIFDTIGVQIQQIINALNISERHVYRVLSGLKDKGLLERVSKRSPYILTDIGRDITCHETDEIDIEH